MYPNIHQSKDFYDKIPVFRLIAPNVIGKAIVLLIFQQELQEEMPNKKLILIMRIQFMTVEMIPQSLDHVLEE